MKPLPPESELRDILNNNTGAAASKILDRSQATISRLSKQFGVDRSKPPSVEEIRVVKTLFDKGLSVHGIARKVPGRSYLFVNRVLSLLGLSMESGEVMGVGIYARRGWPIPKDNDSEILAKHTFEDMPADILFLERRRDGTRISGGVMTRAVQHMALSK